MHAVRIANRCGLAVVNVDYRLAPEHRFPAAVDDAMAAVRWAFAHLDRLGGVDAGLAIGGDSAGGNLAAASAWMARDAGIGLKSQLLIYAATNLSGSRRDGPMASYLGPNFESAMRDPRASPLFAHLEGVAPAIVGIGPHDFLFEDNLAYVEALEKASVPVTLRLFPSLNHGFFSYTAISKVSEAAANQLCDDLGAAMKI
jgi:acetyl esterase/lipase